MAGINNFALKAVAVFANANLEEVYTMPALTSGSVSAAIATTNAGASRNGFLGYKPAGSTITYPLANNITVANGSAINLLVGSQSLAAGDKIVAGCANATTGFYIRPDSGSPYPNTPTVILSNPAGTIICAHCGGSGIWTSLDGGISATRTATATAAAQTGMYFNGGFHFYESATVRRGSTDGLTWATTATASAPVRQITGTGGLLIVGTTAYGAISTTQLGSTTDGLSWASFGATVPSGQTIQGLCWTGTRFVISTAAADQVYSSTNAAAWTLATGLASTVAACQRALACIGGNVLIAMQTATYNYVYLSKDHGLTFGGSQVTYGGSAATTATIIATASGFLTAGTDNGIETFSASGDTGTWTQTPTFVGALMYQSNTGPFLINNNRVMTDTRQSADLTLARRGGLAITLSVMEVS